MNSKVFNFSALIGPVSSEDFFVQYWEQQPLHIQHRGDRYYKNLLSNQDLEHIISHTDLRYPAIKLAKNGTYLPPEAYTNNLKSGEDFFGGIPDIAKISAEYRTGTTVALPALHRTWQPLKELCTLMEAYFDHAVHANAYITPGNTRGFTPHYDTHEVFVLQIAGKKHWHVYEPPVLLPHRSQPFHPQGYALPTPFLEAELKAGDLLYLPRGYVHWANTSSTYSAHITIGVTVYTWVDLASELVKSCKEITRFRKALPPGFASQIGLKQTLKDGLMDLLGELKKNCDYDNLLNTFLDAVTSLQTTRGIRGDRSIFHSDVMIVGPQTILKAPEKWHYNIGREGKEIILQYEGQRLTLPVHFRTTIEVMYKKTSFVPAEFSGERGKEANLALMQYLYTAGFLKIQEQKEP